MPARLESGKPFKGREPSRPRRRQPRQPRPVRPYRDPFGKVGRLEPVTRQQRQQARRRTQRAARELPRRKPITGIPDRPGPHARKQIIRAQGRALGLGRGPVPVQRQRFMEARRMARLQGDRRTVRALDELKGLLKADYQYERRKQDRARGRAVAESLLSPPEPETFDVRAPGHERAAARRGRALVRAQRDARLIPKSQLERLGRLSRPQSPARARAAPEEPKIKVAGVEIPWLASLPGKGKAAGLDVLEETTRPIHGIAGATQYALKGRGAKSAARAFSRGLSNEEKLTFSDVLKTVGVENKAIRGVGGFGLDVVLDPTTYVGFGLPTIGKLAGRLAARKATRGFARAQGRMGGMTAARQTAEVERLVAKARARARVRGKPFTAHNERKIRQQAVARMEEAGAPTIRGARERAMRRAPTGRELTVLGMRTGIRTRGDEGLRRLAPYQIAGKLMYPGFRPLGMDEVSHTALRRARRSARTIKTLGQEDALNRAVAVSKALTDDDHAKVIDAIESEAIKDLPENLRQVAVSLEQTFRGLARRERQQGLLSTTRSGYFPHKLRESIEPGTRPPRSKGKLGAAQRREIASTLKEIREGSLGGVQLFSENVPLVAGTRMAESASKQADVHMYDALRQIGRPLEPPTPRGPFRLESQADISLGGDEAVYHFGPHAPGEASRVSPRKLDIRKRDDRAEILQAAQGQGRSGRYVILNESIAEDVLREVQRGAGAIEEAGRFFDRHIQGRFKTAVTVPNPQYHFTNLYGDTWNAYLAGTKFTDSLRSYRGLRRLGKRRAALRTLGKALDPSDKGLKIGGAKMSYDDLISEAQTHGALSQGFIARDLPQVLDAYGQELAERVGAGRVAKRASRAGKRVARSYAAHPIQGLRNVSQYREDFVRLATYISARKRGLDPEDAADWVATHHFDYGDLTEFEQRILRRAIPFYTFTARNAPLQLRALGSRPGKFANLQKLREEAERLADVPEGYEEQLPLYGQRGLPIPLPAKVDGMPLVMYPRLPATDLARLSFNPREQVQLITSPITPFVKAPVELAANYNFFFGEQIERDSSPRVTAPTWVGKLPKWSRDALNIRREKDKRTGKRKWTWPGKTDYVARFTPISAVAIQLGNPANPNPAHGRGRGGMLQLASWLLGPKFNPYDKRELAMNAAYDRLAVIEKVMTDLRKQERNTGPKYQRLLERRRQMQRRIYNLKKQAGYKVLPKAGRPPETGYGGAYESQRGTGGPGGAYGKSSSRNPGGAYSP